MPSCEEPKEFSIAIAITETTIKNARRLTTTPDKIIISCYKNPDSEIKIDEIDYIEHQDDLKTHNWFTDVFLIIIAPYVSHVSLIALAEKPSIVGIATANLMALVFYIIKKSIFANNVIKIISRGESFYLNLSIKSSQKERAKLIKSLINELLERRDELRFKQLRERLARADEERLD